MTQKELIRQEIERRKELLTPHKGQGMILCREIIKQFDSLLSFIDTISQPIMKNDIIDEIRSEIERRFSEYNHDSNHHIQAAECASILAFIDSLPDEKPSEDLEAEIEMQWDSFNKNLAEYDGESEEVVWLNWNDFNEVIREAFTAGAKWQANQLLKGSPLPEDTVLFQKGVEEGRRLEKDDLALTWEDMAAIDAIILDVNNEFAVDYSKEIDRQKFYKEVLKRFKEDKK